LQVFQAYRSVSQLQYWVNDDFTFLAYNEAFTIIKIACVKLICLWLDRYMFSLCEIIFYYNNWEILSALRKWDYKLSILNDLASTFHPQIKFLYNLSLIVVEYYFFTVNIIRLKTRNRSFSNYGSRCYALSLKLYNVKTVFFLYLL